MIFLLIINLLNLNTILLYISKNNNIIKNQFILYKYAITNIYMNKQNQRKWGIMFVLLQEYGLYGYTIYIEVLKIHKQKDINLDVFEIVKSWIYSKFISKKRKWSRNGKSIPTVALMELNQKKLNP